MDIEQVIRRWAAGEAIRAGARATGLERNTATDSSDGGTRSLAELLGEGELLRYTRASRRCG